MKNHDCYKCKHREKIIGDAHSKCNADVKRGDVKIIVNQWSFFFPINYDPVWIKSCKKYESKIEENEVCQH